MKLHHNIGSLFCIATQAQSYTGGSIKGKVTKIGIEYPCVVSLHDRSSRQLIEAKKTDLQGNYIFENLAFGFVFLLIATDPVKKFNAVIQDNVVPK